MEVFENVKIGNCELKNRIIRTATFEGMSDENGFPTDNYFSFYSELAKNEIGGIITGFTYISKDGKAMHPGQAGIDSADKVPFYKKLTHEVHQYNCRIFMQIAHAGRQTKKVYTGEEVVGCSEKKSFYFRDKPRKLTTDEVYKIIDNFGNSAFYAREAGFDGIQLHAAHGYLLHQFILPSINKRDDIFGIDPQTKIGTKFLELIIDNVRQKCGVYFPLLIKISGSDDYCQKFSAEQFISLIKLLQNKRVDAIEISYGTMDYALNIFRGDLPADLVLSKNPIYKTDSKYLKKLWKIFILPFIKIRLKPFSPMYNLEYALLAKKYTDIPVITVGGFRNNEEIKSAINKNVNFVSLCRALICEPDFIVKIKENENYKSKCINCNYCAIMCDSNNITKCYQNK
jgi:2,4-dienoyl-CoA reductase-like NADH-dependent reductase (Old Yellow Enzyme family)